PCQCGCIIGARGAPAGTASVEDRRRLLLGWADLSLAIEAGCLLPEQLPRPGDMPLLGPQVADRQADRERPAQPCVREEGLAFTVDPGHDRLVVLVDQTRGIPAGLG